MTTTFTDRIELEAFTAELTDTAGRAQRMIDRLQYSYFADPDDLSVDEYAATDINDTLTTVSQMLMLSIRKIELELGATDTSGSFFTSAERYANARKVAELNSKAAKEAQSLTGKAFALWEQKRIAAVDLPDPQAIAELEALLNSRK